MLDHVCRLSQVATIALRAMTAYSESQEQEERRRQKAETDAFTFKVPVTLAGLQLHAEFRVSVLHIHAAKNGARDG